MGNKANTLLRIYSKSVLPVLFILIVPFYTEAKSFYVGDSIAEGYKIANMGNGITKIGASPDKVLNFLNNTPTKQDSLVLSTGASNDCSNINQIQENIRIASSKTKQLLVLSAPYCGEEVNKSIKDTCYSLASCQVGEVKAGADGIHPKTYERFE